MEIRHKGTMTTNTVLLKCFNKIFTKEYENFLRSRVCIMKVVV